MGEITQAKEVADSRDRIKIEIEVDRGNQRRKKKTMAGTSWQEVLIRTKSR
jgi:hypothetical protein